MRNLDPHGGQQTSNKHTTPNGFLDLTGRNRSLKPLGAARIQGHIAVPVSKWVGGPGVPKSWSASTTKWKRPSTKLSHRRRRSNTYSELTSPLVHRQPRLTYYSIYQWCTYKCMWANVCEHFAYICGTYIFFPKCMYVWNLGSHTYICMWKMYVKKVYVCGKMYVRNVCNVKMYVNFM